MSIKQAKSGVRGLVDQAMMQKIKELTLSVSWFYELFMKRGTLISVDHERLLLGFGNRSWMSHCGECDCDHPAFYFPDFFLTEKYPWCVNEYVKEVSIDECIELLLEKTSEDFDSFDFSWKNEHEEQFYQTFSDIQKRIELKEFHKAVPFVFEMTQQKMSATLFHQSLLNMLKYAKKYPVHLYGFWEQGDGMLGATPEQLFSFNKGKKYLLETVACAGTKPSVAVLDQASVMKRLCEDSKELQEHHFVIEGIIESLSPFGKVSLGELKAVPFGKLFHLMTPIVVELENKMAFDSIVRLLHPTPALGTFPKKAGMPWLVDYEKKNPRQRFGAPVGVVAQQGGMARFFVAIRNVQWNEHGMKIGAGCGVVSQSRCESEWNEIKLKIESIKDVFGLHRFLVTQ